jgi:hypothetical protein
MASKDKKNASNQSGGSIDKPRPIVIKAKPADVGVKTHG